MQPLPPIKTHVGSPRSGSINCVAASSSRGTAARILPIFMAAGVLICTALQLWGWFCQGQAFEPLHSKATVSIQATRTGAHSSSSSSSSRRWMQMPVAGQPTQSTAVDHPPAVPLPRATDPGSTSTDSSSGSNIARARVQQQQPQKQHYTAAPTSKLTATPAHNATSISSTSRSTSPGVNGHPPQEAVQKEVAPNPVERTAAHPSSKTPPPGVLLQKKGQNSQPEAAAVVTDSNMAAAARATGASSASLLQLSQAYEESLAALSMALQLSKKKADETAAIREQLLQAYTQNDGKGGTAATISSSKQPQPQQQQQQQQVAIGQVTAEAAAASGGQAQAASSATGSAVSRHTGSTDTSNSWCTRRSGKRVRLFIGVYTGFSATKAEPRYNYAARRAALRTSWFPGNDTERVQLEADHGVVVRFVIGSSDDAKEEAAMLQEEQEHGDIMRLPLEEDYHFLPNKTRTFFRMVTDKWEPDWVIKMDDDVYLNIPRLLETARQWDKMGAQYVGCMKHGVVWTAPGSRWYEPANILVGPTYWLHSYGSIYAIAGPTASCVIGAAFDRLRLLANEDTSVGLWMLASNVVHFEDMRLCSPVCTNASVAVQRTECAGLCNPIEDLKLLHANSKCSMAPEGHLLYHKSYPEYAAFERMWVE